MSTQTIVQAELDDLRGHLKGAPIGDALCWGLCRLALGDDTGAMPKEEIPLKVATVVDKLLALRVEKLTAIPSLGHLGHSDGDIVEINLKLELHGVPQEHAEAIKHELPDRTRGLLREIKARYEHA